MPDGGRPSLGVFSVPTSCLSAHQPSSLMVWLQELAWRSEQGGLGMEGILGSDLHLPIREKQRPQCSMQLAWHLDG